MNVEHSVEISLYKRQYMNIKVQNDKFISSICSQQIILGSSYIEIGKGTVKVHLGKLKNNNLHPLVTNNSTHCLKTSMAI